MSKKDKKSNLNAIYHLLNKALSILLGEI